MIEYSINNGASWVDAGSLFKSAGDWGYQGSIASGLGNPLGGRQGYVGRSDGYFSSRATLTELAGKSVRFRYRIGADGSIGSYGWYIDDLRVYTCAAPVAPPPTTNKLQNPGFELDNNDDRRLDFWSWDSSALRMPTVKRTGQYALRLRAVDNQPFVFGQTVTGLTQGTTYTTQGYFNIPATTKLVNARLEIKWRNSANAIHLDDGCESLHRRQRRGVAVCLGRYSSANGHKQRACSVGSERLVLHRIRRRPGVQTLTLEHTRV